MWLSGPRQMRITPSIKTGARFCRMMKKGFTSVSSARERRQLARVIIISRIQKVAFSVQMTIKSLKMHYRCIYGLKRMLLLLNWRYQYHIIKALCVA